MQSEKETRDEGLTGVLKRGDLLVVVVGAALLLTGWVVRSKQMDQNASYVGHGVAFEHPKSWGVVEGPAAGTLPPASAELFDLMATATFKPKIEVLDERLPASVKTGAQLGDYVLLNLQSELTLFHLKRQTVLKVGGKEACRVDYAYAVNPTVAGQPGDTDVPVIVHASKVAIIDGARLHWVTVLTPGSAQRRDPKFADRVMQTLRTSK